MDIFCRFSPQKYSLIYFKYVHELKSPILRGSPYKLIVQWGFCLNFGRWSILKPYLWALKYLVLIGRPNFQILDAKNVQNRSSECQTILNLCSLQMNPFLGVWFLILTISISGVDFIKIKSRVGVFSKR